MSKDMPFCREHLQVVPLHRIGRDEFTQRPIYTSVERLDGEECGLATKEEYALQAIIGVRFSTNRAEYQQARELAEKVLWSRLYGDIRRLTIELRLAISNGHREACYEIADRMQRLTEGTYP